LPINRKYDIIKVHTFRGIVLHFCACAEIGGNKMLRKKTRELLRFVVLGGFAAAVLVMSAHGVGYILGSSTGTDTQTTVEAGKEQSGNAIPIVQEPPIVVDIENIYLTVPELIERATGITQVNAKPQEQAITWRYEPTEAEYDAACKLAFAEAGNQGATGQTAVIEVVLNAIDAGYATTVLEEINRSGRYSTVRNGTICFYDGKGNVLPVTEEYLTEELKEAVTAAFMGERPTEVALCMQAQAQGMTDECYWKGGAIYFFNWEYLDEASKASRDYESMPVRADIGDHTFARYWS